MTSCKEGEYDEDYRRHWKAISVVSCVFMLFSYLSVPAETGSLTVMIAKIMYEMFWFTIIVIIVMGLYTFGFFILNPHDQKQASHSFISQAIKTFALILGDFELEDYEGGVNRFLFITFMFFVVIVNLNLLIATVPNVVNNCEFNAMRFPFLDVIPVLNRKQVLRRWLHKHVKR